MNKRKVRNRLSFFILLLQVLTILEAISLEIAFTFLCALIVMGLSWGHDDIEIQIKKLTSSAGKKTKESDKDG